MNDKSKLPTPVGLPDTPTVRLNDGTPDAAMALQRLREENPDIPWEANLGLATTRQLLKEILVRGKLLGYKTDAASRADALMLTEMTGAMLRQLGEEALEDRPVKARAQATMELSGVSLPATERFTLGEGYTIRNGYIVRRNDNPHRREEEARPYPASGLDFTPAPADFGYDDRERDC